MKRPLLVAAALAIAAPSLANTPDAVVVPPPHGVTDTVQAELDRYERLTVPVTIEGRGPYRFMVDTGAQATVVSRALSEAIGLPPLGRANLVAMGSVREVDIVRLDGLGFAGRVYDNLHSPLLERHNLGADGILGLDSLQDLRVLIDFTDQSMTVSDGHELGGNNGYEIVVRARRKLGQMIIADARVDGIRTAVVIDTGAQHTVGNAALRKKLKARETSQVIASDVHGATLLGDLAYARGMEIGELSLAGVPITFAASPAFEALDLHRKPALIMGMQNLSKLDRVAIDFARRQVLFDLPDEASRPSATWHRFFGSSIDRGF